MNAEPPAQKSRPRYDERLWVPVTWWVVVAFLVVSFWFAFWIAIPGPLGHVPGIVAAVAAVGGLLRFGAVRISVDTDGLVVGAARLPLAAAGDVEVLSPTHARVLRGAGADASAYFCLRPYVGTAVRVDVADPDDPTPYWYVATRHPERLAAALRAAVRPDG